MPECIVAEEVVQHADNGGDLVVRDVVKDFVDLGGVRLLEDAGDERLVQVGDVRLVQQVHRVDPLRVANLALDHLPGDVQDHVLDIVLHDRDEVEHVGHNVA